MKNNIIKAILDWIEKNINSPLSQDDVINKSGYSKRHFQDIFYNETGNTIARYILLRRLSLSATLLRLTKLSILEISVNYQFNSQQSFSRAFKRHFKVTPFVYRKDTYWDFTYYLPQHNYFDFKKLEPKEVFIDITFKKSKEKIFYVNIPFELTALISRTGMGFKNKDEIIKLKNLIKMNQYKYLNIYYRYEKSPFNKNILTVFDYYESMPTIDSIFSKNGDKYYKFSFYGTWDEYLNLSNVIYSRELSKLKAKKRNGYDIEIFNVKDMKSDSNICSLDYFIPIL
ncbi:MULTISPECIES: helix-turn-helix domain-containing protein [Proteus]|uniref:helix-turn-helix domain-containing protein n=1 Tax=Proteus TaxID=583 RepID=UPI000D699DDC|nr:MULTISPECIES: helix-turn-helix domain-containing protein [Proteus]MCM2367799.1 helix-turn-helix domain-containing protein [Proteus sp. FZP2095]